VTPSFHAPDGGLFRKERGGGPPVLLLHGNPGSHADFDPLAERLAQAGFRAVAPDRPGHGRSAALPNLHRGSYHAAPTLANLLDEACGGRAIVAGYSIGAYYALRLALAKPEAVRALVLVSPFVFPGPGDKISGLPGLAGNPLLRPLLRLILPALGRGKVAAHARRAAAPDAISDAEAAAFAARGAAFPELVAVMADKNDLVANPLDPGRIAKLPMPVLIVSGGADAVADPAVHLAPLAAALPAATVVTLEGAPHDLPGRRLDALAKNMLAFMPKN